MPSPRRASTINGWISFYTHDVCETPSAYGSTPAMLEEVLKRLAEARIAILPMREAVAAALGTSRRGNVSDWPAREPALKRDARRQRHRHRISHGSIAGRLEASAARNASAKSSVLVTVAPKPPQLFAHSAKSGFCSVVAETRPG